MSRTVVVWKVISLLYDQEQGDTTCKFVFGREKHKKRNEESGMEKA